jgi:hypothetical protein
VLIMPMAGKGVELASAADDPQFGPIVMVGAGGVLIEIMADRRFALAPFDAPPAACSTASRTAVARWQARPASYGLSTP